MSTFPRALYGEDPTFTNLFRMLDDFATYSREGQGTQDNNVRHVRQRLINPRFDMRETENAYELHGELPGIDREHLQIEFTEPQTIHIRGRVERNYTTGTPPTAVEGTQMSGAITEGSENGHKDAEPAKEKRSSSTAVTQQERSETPKRHDRYWHQERSIGEFHRTFSFPTRVDESNVKANLDKGILHVTVPKAAKPETRRINIE